MYVFGDVLAHGLELARPAREKRKRAHDEDLIRRLTGSGFTLVLRVRHDGRAHRPARLVCLSREGKRRQSRRKGGERRFGLTRVLSE